MFKKSVALILGFIAIITLICFSSVILSRSVTESNLTKRYTESTQAFWLAEAGIQRAIWELNNGGGTWSGWTDTGGNKSITVSLSTGDFSVTVTNPASASPSVESRGHIPNIGTNRIERDLDIVLGSETISPFSYAGFGKTSVTMSGNGETDSYNSGVGAYGGSNVGTNGDIGTNGIAAGVINLSGNSSINGDANTGAGGTVTLSGNAEVNGTTDDSCSENFSSVTVPSSLSGLSSSGSYSLGSNNTAALNAGDYKFSSMAISGNAILTLSGTINIYFTESSSDALKITGNGKIIVASGATINVYTNGKCDLSGNGVVNNTSLPENFLIYSTYSGSADGVKITGNGNFYGAIYAPDTQIKVTGNGDVYGALVGSTLTVTGNGDIHYDEALQDVGSAGSSNYSVGTWREKYNPYPLGS